MDNSRCRMHICVRDDVQGRRHFGTAHPPEMLLIRFGSVARKSSGVGGKDPGSTPKSR